MLNRSSSSPPGTQSDTRGLVQQTFPRNVVQRFPLISFFVLAYVLAWSGTIAEVELHPSWLPTLLLDFLVNWAPGMAGLIVIAILQGGSGMRALLRPLLWWHVHPGWYLLVLGLAPLVVLTAIGVGMLFGGPVPVFSKALTPRLALLPILLFFNTGEEVGWRGFALPRLQSRFTPLVASLILGVIWGLWHAPNYVLTGRSLLLIVFLPSVMAQTFLMTWIYNRTAGNLLLLALFHWSWDSMLELIAPAWLPPAGVVSMFIIATTISVVLAIIVATRINFYL
jgi:membrane protease YdiL (CAAX protease family)